MVQRESQAPNTARHLEQFIFGGLGSTLGTVVHLGLFFGVKELRPCKGDSTYPLKIGHEGDTNQD